MRPTYYEPSKRFSAVGLVRGLFWGTLWGVLASFVYAYGILYLPIVELNLMLLIGFGLIIGAATMLSLRGGKVRNRTASVAVAAATGALSLYAAWGIWIKALLHRNDMTVKLTAVLFDPSGLWQMIKVIDQQGAWRYHGTTVSGIVLWLVWGLEALAILGIAVGLGGMMPFEVFCEECNSWADKKTKGKLAAGDAAAIKRQLESQDLAAVQALGPAAADAGSWLELSLESCKKCGKTNALSAAIVSPTVSKEGQKLEGRQAVVRRLLITPEQAASLALSS